MYTLPQQCEFIFILEFHTIIIQLKYLLIYFYVTFCLNLLLPYTNIEIYMCLCAGADEQRRRRRRQQLYSAAAAATAAAAAKMAHVLLC